MCKAVVRRRSQMKTPLLESLFNNGANTILTRDSKAGVFL